MTTAEYNKMLEQIAELISLKAQTPQDAVEIILKAKSRRKKMACSRLPNTLHTKQNKGVPDTLHRGHINYNTNNT